MSVLKLTKENFATAIGSETALVDFFAEWCGPCHMVSPIVDEIARENANITVGKVDVDENNALAVEYGIVNIPTLIVFKNGKEHARLVGYKPKDEILAKLI